MVSGMLCWACWPSAALSGTAPGRIEFNRDIRPIITENCYACHGPDKNQRKAKLRLDQREIALERGAIVPGKPASRAGLQTGDIVRAVDAQKIEYWDQFVDLVRASGGRTLQLTVDRKGQPLTLSVTPKQGAADPSEKNYQIGIAPEVNLAYRSVRPVEAVKSATLQTGDIIVQTFGVLSKLFSGRVSVKELQSVVGISRAAGEAVAMGSFAIISFMALISVNLGILNLLPIPILDGGHILLLSLEGLRRRDFSLAFKERFIQVGLVFLLVLFAYVMYNDVVRQLPIHS